MTLKTSEIPAQALRRDAGDLLARIQYQGERIVVTKHGKPIVAMVPIADLELIESALDKGKMELVAFGGTRGSSKEAIVALQAGRALIQLGKNKSKKSKNK
jgi:prevent-host-death family protein